MPARPLAASTCSGDYLIQTDQRVSALLSIDASGLSSASSSLWTKHEVSRTAVRGSGCGEGRANIRMPMPMR